MKRSETLHRFTRDSWKTRETNHVNLRETREFYVPWTSHPCGATLPFPSLARAKDTADLIHLRSSCVCVFDTLKKEFTSLRTFRAVWNFSTSGRKRPRESLEDISVGSRASGLRNDRWARVFSPVSEKVSFFSSPRYRRMCEVIFHFLRAPSVIDHFFPPSMIDKIIIIIIVVVIVAIRTNFTNFITNFSDLYWIIRREHENFNYRD